MVDIRSAKINVAPAILIFLWLILMYFSFFRYLVEMVSEKLSSNLECLPSFRLVNYDMYHEVFSRKNFDFHNSIISVSGRREKRMQIFLIFICIMRCFGGNTLIFITLFFRFPFPVDWRDAYRIFLISTNFLSILYF